MSGKSNLFTYAPNAIYLLIDNEYFEGDRYIKNGVVIIRLSEYKKFCSNGYPRIHRAASSPTALKKWIRTAQSSLREAKLSDEAPRG